MGRIYPWDVVEIFYFGMSENSGLNDEEREELKEALTDKYIESGSIKSRNTYEPAMKRYGIPIPDVPLNKAEKEEKPPLRQ